MKIHNVRLGFAANSSSMHSVLLFGDGDAPMPAVAPESSDYYGWDPFRLVRPESKRDYLAAQVQSALQRLGLAAHTASAVVRDLLGVSSSVSIDHQSEWCLPLAWGTGLGLDHDFIVALRDALTRPSVCISGGNDNDEGSVDCCGGVDVTYPLCDSADKVRARRDGGLWTIFNASTGAKIRLSLPGTGIIPTRSSYPELVDVKITDRCHAACPFCYQASTPQGKDAKNLWAIAQMLGQWKVFEVAIGGGEPTEMPELADFIDQLTEMSVMPNLTTRSTSWLVDDRLRSAVEAHCGAVAFSVRSANDVHRVIDALKPYSVLRAKATAQYIYGLGEYEEVADACGAAPLPLTVLGWKRLGRGATMEPKKERTSWLTLRPHIPRLCVDTALLATVSDEELRAAHIVPQTYDRQEGAFSCYIDAVTGTMAPSSYCEPEQARTMLNANGRLDEVRALAVWRGMSVLSSIGLGGIDGARRDRDHTA